MPCLVLLDFCLLSFWCRLFLLSFVILDESIRLLFLYRRFSMLTSIRRFRRWSSFMQNNSRIWRSRSIRQASDTWTRSPTDILRTEQTAEVCKKEVRSLFSGVFRKPSTLNWSAKILRRPISSWSHSNFWVWRDSVWIAPSTFGPWTSWRPCSRSSRTWPNWSSRWGAWPITTSR